MLNKRLVVGDRIRLSDGTEETVTELEGNIVVTDKYLDEYQDFNCFIQYFLDGTYNRNVTLIGEQQ